MPLGRIFPLRSGYRIFPIDPLVPGADQYRIDPLPFYYSIPVNERKFKLYDYSFTSIQVANEVTHYETPVYDEGQPNVFKRFRKLIIEVDNIDGGTITVTPEIDGSNLTSFDITATGRQETVYSFPVDTTGYLWRIKATTTSSMRFYSVKVEAIQDPTHVTIYESPWVNEGTINRKRFRDIILEINTWGYNVTVTPWIDGAAQSTFTVNTDNRETVVLSLPVDTTGSLVRLTTSGANYHTIYGHRFTYTEEPHFGTVRETVWTDEGWPYDKLWKHMSVELDTGGVASTLSFWVDNSVVSTFPVTTSGREIRTLSFGQNVIGKLGRLTISGTNAQLFNAKFVTDKEPPDVTSADSYEQDFGSDNWKVLRRMYAAIKAPAAVTISVYADEDLKDTLTVTSDLASGYAKVKLDMVSNIKGKLFRFVFSSSEAFKLYWEKSQIELKVLNKDDGWQLYHFRPPETF
jgi:hypothetical protein